MQNRLGDAVLVQWRGQLTAAVLDARSALFPDVGSDKTVTKSR